MLPIDIRLSTEMVGSTSYMGYMDHSTELVQTSSPHSENYLEKTMKYSDLRYLQGLCYDLFKPNVLI